MADFIVTECMTDGCTNPLPGEPSVYYCDTCVLAQIKAMRAEREAFEAYHRFADDVARRTR